MSTQENFLKYNGSWLKWNDQYVRIITTIPEPDTSGGTITYDGDYKIHTYNSSGNFIIEVVSTDVSVLIVGGGGYGGSQKWGGGGGGGGEVKLLSMTLSPNTYPVIVGNASENSSFNSVEASCGHIGVFDNGGMSGSGFPGGDGNGNLAGGGGGGDSSAGYPYGIPTSSYGGYGGDGTKSNISGTLKGYGGGGGGGTWNVEARRGIGKDGGGNGCYTYGGFAPTAGAANTGGGGGGGSDYILSDPCTNTMGAPGGSGIVIIRYKYK